MLVDSTDSVETQHNTKALLENLSPPLPCSKTAIMLQMAAKINYWPFFQNYVLLEMFARFRNARPFQIHHHVTLTEVKHRYM